MCRPIFGTQVSMQRWSTCFVRAVLIYLVCSLHRCYRSRQHIAGVNATISRWQRDRLHGQKFHISQDTCRASEITCFSGTECHFETRDILPHRSWWHWVLLNETKSARTLVCIGRKRHSLHQALFSWYHPACFSVIDDLSVQLQNITQ
jgi:hypothetical protein